MSVGMILILILIATYKKTSHLIPPESVFVEACKAVDHNRNRQGEDEHLKTIRIFKI